MDERQEATIEVPAKGGEPPAESKEPQLAPGPNPELDETKKGEEMNKEDRELKERLELAVERLREPNPELQRAAMELLRKEIREATSSMTSVPKPLKFLSKHWGPLKAFYKTIGGQISILAGPPPSSPKEGEAAGKKADTNSTTPNSTVTTTVVATDENRRLFADVLSVLAMTMGTPSQRETLRYKLVGNTSDVDSWGHEYVRHLAGEIAAEWNARKEYPESGAGQPQDLLPMIRVIIPFDMSHNAEVEAVDLCLETSQLNLLLEPNMVQTDSNSRVCLYLLKCGDYIGDADETAACVDTAFQLYLAHGQYVDALRIALRSKPRAAPGAMMMDDSARHARIQRVFEQCKDSGIRKQLGHVLGRYRSDFAANEATVGEDADAVNAAIGNRSLSELYLALAKDLDVLEPKAPEDVFKTHLSGNVERGGLGGAAAKDALDSAKANLASTYVNAFVNAGYGTDKLMTPADSKWVFKNKEYGQVAAAASLGMLYAWDENQLSELDKYLEADEEFVRAGALLGIGLVCTGTRSDIDPAFALLSDHVGTESASSHNMKISATLGLGMVYAGSNREDVSEPLRSHLMDTSSMELSAVAGLSLGLLHVGSAREDVAALIADRLMECSETDAAQAITRHLSLGLGLLYLGQQDACETILEVVNAITHSVGQTTAVLVRACAYAGTGDMIQLQSLLRLCAEHPEGEEKEKKEKAAEEATKQQRERAAATAAAGGQSAAGRPAGAAAAAANPLAAAAAAAGVATPAAVSVETSGKFMHQSAAVLGLALVSMGEELSIELATRMADHLLQYGDTAVRRTVPLALALLHLSDPQPAIVDSLSRLTHDPNEETAQAAIFGLGLVGAGTNNSRIAGLLRTLATFYKTEPGHLFVVRIAQGVLHAGKGLLTLNPLHSDRMLLSPIGLAGLLPAVMLFLEPGPLLHTSKWHIFLYTLSMALNPRFMTTVDETGGHVAVEVRVGQAVETVGQAGRPKTITGFQTHTTPVLIGVKDRAELADDTYVALTPVLEGIVVLRTNPASKTAKAKTKKAAGSASASAGK